MSDQIPVRVFLTALELICRQRANWMHAKAVHNRRAGQGKDPDVKRHYRLSKSNYYDDCARKLHPLIHGGVTGQFVSVNFMALCICHVIGFTERQKFLLEEMEKLKDSPVVQALKALELLPLPSDPSDSSDSTEQV